MVAVGCADLEDGLRALTVAGVRLELKKRVEGQKTEGVNRGVGQTESQEFYPQFLDAQSGIGRALPVLFRHSASMPASGRDECCREGTRLGNERTKNLGVVYSEQGVRPGRPTAGVARVAVGIPGFLR